MSVVQFNSVRSSGMSSDYMRFVQLYASIERQSWYKTHHHAFLFTHLLLRAAHKPCVVFFRGCKIDLLAGQLATSLNQLNKETGLTIGVIRGALRRFELENDVEIKMVDLVGKKGITCQTIKFKNWLNFNQNSRKTGKNLTHPLTQELTQELTHPSNTPSNVLIDADTSSFQGFNATSINTPSNTPLNIGANTGANTQNNTTISKDIVLKTCSEQSSEPMKILTDIILPLNKKQTFHHVSQADYNEYLELFPSVNIKHEFRLMFRWFKDNPKRKKTKVGICRFITSWLGKEQNKGFVKKTSYTEDLTNIGWAENLEIDGD